MTWNDHYDEQKATPASDTWRKSRNTKKDTKRWCRGKVGVAHTPEVRFDKFFAGRQVCHERTAEWAIRLSGPGWKCFHQKVCTNCGKITQHWLTDTKECPVWQEQNT